MEKKIAIRGHKTRGKEVIRALEGMGGTNKIGFDGSDSTQVYYICHDFMISTEKLDKPSLGESYSLYTIEEYEEYMKNLEANTDCANKILADEALRQHEVPTGSIKIWDLPDGYIFKDDNGNVINATKIVLEKKKKEYPNTYKECRKIMGVDTDFLFTGYDLDLWKGHLLSSLQKLLICRDAYWKIAGEEMGLNKPWEPDWCDYTTKYCILYSPQYRGICKRQYDGIKHILAFPTEEMRDAFYENFKELIEECKELL